jgi:general secretion pathway protein H
MDDLPLRARKMSLSLFFRHYFARHYITRHYVGSAPTKDFILSDNSTAHERGFTLLELLVVLLIIGIIVSFAGLSIGQRSSRVVHDEAERLNGLFQMASDEAVMDGRELAVEFAEDGYQFLELNQDNKWVPIEKDNLFRKRELPPDIKLDLVVEGAEASFKDKKTLPKVFVLSSGELTAFTLTLSVEGEQPYVLQGNSDGKLSLSTGG